MRMHGKCTVPPEAQTGPIRMPDQITRQSRRAVESRAIQLVREAEAERQWFDEGRSAGRVPRFSSATGAGAPLQVGSGFFQQRFDGRGLAQALEIGVLSGK